MTTLNQRSLDNLKGVHQDLVTVVMRAAVASPIDFMVIEGLRTVERQRQLVAKGASKTMNSRHITGHAVDIAPVVDGEIRWDWPLFYKLAPVIKAAALNSNVPIVWGGDWVRFKDGPHWELARTKYP